MHQEFSILHFLFTLCWLEFFFRNIAAQSLFEQFGLCIALREINKNPASLVVQLQYFDLFQLQFFLLCLQLPSMTRFDIFFSQLEENFLNSNIDFYDALSLFLDFQTLGLWSFVFVSHSKFVNKETHIELI